MTLMAQKKKRSSSDSSHCGFIVFIGLCYGNFSFFAIDDRIALYVYVRFAVIKGFIFYNGIFVIATVKRGE